MSYRFVLGLVVIAGLGWPGGAAGAEEAGAPPVEVFRPVAEDSLGVLGAVPGAAGTGGKGAAAARLVAEALTSSGSCHPELRRAALVVLAWRPAVGSGEAGSGPLGQRVEISKFHDGFERGSFEVTRELPALAAAVAVEAPEPGVNYYWRVLTRGAAGWTASAVERFEVPICPWDGRELEPPAAARASVGGRAKGGSR